MQHGLDTELVTISRRRPPRNRCHERHWRPLARNPRICDGPRARSGGCGRPGQLLLRQIGFDGTGTVSSGPAIDGSAPEPRRAPATAPRSGAARRDDAGQARSISSVARERPRCHYASRRSAASPPSCAGCATESGKAHVVMNARTTNSEERFTPGVGDIAKCEEATSRHRPDARHGLYAHRRPRIPWDRNHSYIKPVPLMTCQ
jgi:hypothetical protein